VRIAILGTRGVPARYGGFETAAEEIGIRLADWGHEVVVYCRNPGQRQNEYRGMTLVNLPAVRVKAVETISHTGLSAVHAILRGKPDVVFLFNAANAPYISLFRASGIPVAIHVDGLEWRRAKWGRRGSAYYRWAEARSARWAQAVIADSLGIVDHLMAEHGVLATYIPYGAPVVVPNPQRLAEVGLEPRSYHLVVARFEPENHLTEIVSGYVSSKCRLPLMVVGDAAYGDAYRKEVLKAAQDDLRVRFLGSIWDQDLLDALYAGAASYLHGHSVGGTNPSLLRAMGAGAPVIANAVAFNKEVAAGNGRYFSTPHEVALACESVELNPEEALARGFAGRVDVSERFQWEEVADQYEKLAHLLFVDGEISPSRRASALFKHRGHAEPRPVSGPRSSPSPDVVLSRSPRRERQVLPHNAP
jgi:glycosyltransferase involved in cell wall biosynthesis